jgi:hypothetical protein
MHAWMQNVLIWFMVNMNPTPYLLHPGHSGVFCALLLQLRGEILCVLFVEFGAKTSKRMFTLCLHVLTQGLERSQSASNQTRSTPKTAAHQFHRKLL